MLRHSVALRKNPIIFKQGQGMFTHQLKRILNKKSLHKYNWDPLPMYDPRKLVHAGRFVDHDSYQEVYDPHWVNNAYDVPDQQYCKIPVPAEYKDAYWWRDLQARRVQCPVEWVSHRMYSKVGRRRFDFQDLGFKKKFEFSLEEVVQNAKDMRS